MPVTNEDLAESFKAVPVVGDKTACSICDKPILEIEKFMMQLAIKVPLLPKVKKFSHYTCAEKVIDVARNSIFEAKKKSS